MSSHVSTGQLHAGMPPCPDSKSTVSFQTDQPNQGHSAGMFSGQTFRGRVLVVDSEIDIRRIMRMILGKAGYYVMEAEDGEQAIRTVNEGENPKLLDVILITTHLPKINGLQATEYIRREHPGISIIVQTGRPELLQSPQLTQLGVLDILLFPVDPEKILASVARAMESRRSFLDGVKDSKFFASE